MMIAVLHVRGRDDSPDPEMWMKVVYGIVAVGMAVVVVLAAIAVIAQRIDPDAGQSLPVPPVLACEVAALVLFLVFWVVQSIQRWDDERAPSLAA